MSKIKTYRETNKVGSGQGKIIYLNIPIAFIIYVLGHNAPKEGLKDFFRAKAALKSICNKKDFPKWKAMKRMGLIRENTKDNTLFHPKSLKEWKGPTVKVPVEVLTSNKVTAAFSAALTRYMLEVHNEVADNGKLRKQIKPARVQSGQLNYKGISHSLFAKAARMSKSTAARCRKEVVKADFGTYQRRRVILSYAAGDERQTVLQDSHGGPGFIYADKSGIVWKEFTAEAFIPFFDIRYKRIPKHKAPKSVRNFDGSKMHKTSWSSALEDVRHSNWGF